MTTESDEGWFTDPFQRHEARWLSGGVPTKLVRDGEVEAYDDPPDEPPSVTPVRVETAAGDGSADDLLRADDAETTTFDAKKVQRAAWDQFDRTSGTGGGV